MRFGQNHPRQERWDELKQSIDSSLPRFTPHVLIGRELRRRHATNKPQEPYQGHSHKENYVNPREMRDRHEYEGARNQESDAPIHLSGEQQHAAIWLNGHDLPKVTSNRPMRDVFELLAHGLIRPHAYKPLVRAYSPSTFIARPFCSSRSSNNDARRSSCSDVHSVALRFSSSVLGMPSGKAI